MALIKLSKKKIALGLGSIVVIVLLLSKIELRELVDAILSIDPMAYALAFVVYVFNYYVRILRLQVVLGKFSLGKWFQFMGIFQLMNRTLPFRSGEIFFPVLIKRMFQISSAEAISKLIIVRFLDLISLLVFFLVALFWVQVDQVGLALALAGIVIIGLVIFYTQRVPIINLVVRVLTNIKPQLKEKVETLGQNVLAAFAISRKQLLALTFYSFLDKAVNFGVFIILVGGMGFGIAIDKLCVAIGLSGFSEILPINSLGSFGTLELGWVGALTMLGVEQNISIQSGFSSHIVSFSYTILLGLISGLLYLLSRRR